MFLTCSECETKYKLSDAKLGAEGHKVRCTSCGHIWFAEPPFASHAEAHGFREELAHQELAREFPKHDVDENLLDQIGFEETGAEEESAPTFDEPDYSQQTPGDHIPDVVKPFGKGMDIPVIEYRPMGMGPLQFGLFGFLLCTFLTLSLLFGLKKNIAHMAPVMTSFYKAFGVDIHAAGEGLRLAELVAENTIDHRGEKLKISARLANISDHDLPYPAMRAVVKSAYGAELKTWDIKTEGPQKIASGQSIPIEAVFTDPPEGGRMLGLEVVEK